MKRRLIKQQLLVMIGVLLCLAPAICAHADDRSEITALFGKMSAAMKSRNVDAMMALLTPDYKKTKINGKDLNLKDAEKEFRSFYGSMKSVSIAEVKPDEIRLNGTTAFTWTQYSISAEIVDNEGKMGPRGAKHAYVDNGKTREWLLKTPKGWRFQRSEMLKENPTVDGQSTHRMGPGSRR